ncbi:asparaginase [Marinobacterium mangrovicola]|uniref:asparaginase n=1 Tax=Marinobacterium mangrovicola TaxID=1476959 RepID=A0A4R1GMS1_9GAMM|nr:asparaginase [Marinobacterium mangrovicola]TCK08551.1 asparaginase [Marinobacterium mangrovicola]
MSARVLVIYTGGTIGMVPSEQGYVPEPGFHDRVQAQLDSLGEAALPEYDLIELDRLIDSANLVPNDWREIALAIEQNWKSYDGFVVLHGTDTLAYTASALSFMLEGTNKPVILTGSQIPLAQLRNDALDNLVTSLMLAASREIFEVCVYFNGRLLRGNRSLKVRSSGFDAFDSPNAPWLGQAGINIDLRPDLLLPPGRPCFQIPEFDPAAVTVLTVFPGMPASLIEAAVDSSAVNALVLQTYGVGNPPDADAALIGALEAAAKRGVCILNLTQCQQGAVSQGAYATGATLNRIGVVPGADMTLEAAFTKLHYLLALGVEGEELGQSLKTSLRGELSES